MSISFDRPGVPLVSRPRDGLRISLALIAATILSHCAARADDLQDYAQQCTQATGTTIPDFDCDAGTEVPVTHPTAAGTCDRPNRLNRQCDPGSHFQVLTRSADAYVVAHCRKKGAPAGDYGDIAIIQYSRKNGATCFYQALSPSLPGKVKSPAKGQGAWPWISPAGTAGIQCAECHDNGPFIRSPYINQVTGPNAMPGADDFSFNSTQPYAFVGKDFASWKAYKVEVKGNECTGCHRLGANNLQMSGTAIDFGIRATAASETAKNPPSADSPIWMPPVPEQVAFNPAHANSAKIMHDCALRVRETPLPNTDTCRITQYAAAFAAALPPVTVIAGLNHFTSPQFGLDHQTDVFLTDANGALRVAWVVGSGAWNPPVALSGAGMFPKGATIATSAQFGLSGQTDLFAVDKNGTLNVAWVVNAGHWNGPAPIGAVGRFPAGASVTASAQFGVDDQTDVVAVDTSGALNVAWVTAGSKWSGPVPFSPPGRFPPGAPVASSNQFGQSHQTDVFAIDKTGTLNVAWVVGTGHWNGPAAIGGAVFPPGAAVTTSRQFGINNQTDVFAVDKNGALNVAWVVDAGHWNGPVPISPAGRFPPGAVVTVSQQFGIDNQTDVFAVDKSGTLNVAWVVGGGHWNGPVSIGPAGRFVPGTAVSASAQFGLDHQTDVFAVDKDGFLNVAWVVNAGAWNGPVPIH